MQMPGFFVHGTAPGWTNRERGAPIRRTCSMSPCQADHHTPFEPKVSNGVVTRIAARGHRYARQSSYTLDIAALTSCVRFCTPKRVRSCRKW